MNVSVVIPSHNAAETIAETLESLLAQTYSGWEAIVVDDGSTDETAPIAASFAERDARIRVISQPQGGANAARNAGIALARYEWLLFLDADDWLLPQHLERMTEALLADPTLDAVYCGWARVTPNGEFIEREEFYQPGDLFPVFARHCPFPPHVFVIRRSLVEAVGGFDTSFRTGQDWDFWQRIARTGVRFGVIREVLACYRARPGSISTHAPRQLWTDALRLITLGHSPDPRVPNPDPAHAGGLPAQDLPGARLNWVCWPAGLILGRGEDARPLLEAVKEDRYPGLDPFGVAHNIFRAVPIGIYQTFDAWVDLWPTIERRLDEFLLALEEQSKAPGLARRARTLLEHLILEHSMAAWPLTVGATHAIRIEVTEPISDILLPAPVERLRCTVELEGAHIGTIELPVCDGLVPGPVLADAIAAEFAWPILGRFFERTVYCDLSVEREPTGLSLRRGDLRLTEGLPEDEGTFWPQAHDRVGWTVFLQELWARPDWPSERFYDPQAPEEAAARRCAADGWFTVEVSEDLPDLEVCGHELDVVLTVGGVALGVVIIPVEQNILHTQELRAALTSASGFELCRAVVREGLLGRPMAGPESLRERLAAAASEAAQLPGWPDAPGSARALEGALSPGEPGVVLGRRTPEAFGTSASRRAILPAAAACELVEAAAVAGEPIVQVPQPGEQPARVIYAPDLIQRPFRGKQASATGAIESGAVQAADVALYGRSHFETLFAKRPDPWGYTSPYEQTKHEQTLSLLPSTRIERALELACAEGHFTAQLAPHVGSLIAADISQIALDRAAKRCAGLENVRFVHLDLTRDPLPGRFDLIVCSEVLYYAGGREGLQAVVQKLVDALEPGGYLLTAHTNLVVDEPDRAGFDWDFPFGAKVIGETFASTLSLRLVKELRTPLYRIQLFRRASRVRLPFRHHIPEVIELAQQPTPLPPEAAAHVLWHGGFPQRNSDVQTVVTDRLPILMYHRVAPADSPTANCYRVTPEAFEEQLRYLRDAAYYSVRLEEWRGAMKAYRPLPGRAVVITFDDGYLDFLTYAWPLLKSYGFSAIVFLVADEVGRSNRWDRVCGEEVPLLAWKEIRQLQDEGVEFGSHSASHRSLTLLSPAEVVREGARSRAILGRGLGVPVKAFAYPYGDVDRVIEHLIGACGYVFGLSRRQDRSTFYDSLLALPRIEVTGSDGLQEFVEKISP